MKTRDRIFTRRRIERILSSAVGKTLGEVDCTNQFARAVANPKITGIAGDVIEQSVLGMERDSRQEPDIVVDGESVELKTTGIQQAKDASGYEAKEPVSITAVGIDSIARQRFETSHFYQKIARLLFVFYLYDRTIGNKIVAADYAQFTIMGYRFHQFGARDMAMLRNDWQLVHDFITAIQIRYRTDEERKKHYPSLSSALRSELMVLDTAPKYPHAPRFRLKRVFVTTIISQHFQEESDKLTQLATPITKYSEIDEKCHRLTMMFRGMTAEDLFVRFGLMRKSDARYANNPSTKQESRRTNRPQNVRARKRTHKPNSRLRKDRTDGQDHHSEIRRAQERRHEAEAHRLYRVDRPEHTV